jgi:hypothetical protein
MSKRTASNAVHKSVVPPTSGPPRARPAVVRCPPLLLRAVLGLKGNLVSGTAAACKDLGGIYVAPFKGNARASASISADFELAWAWKGCDPGTRDTRGATERANVPRLVELLESYRVPITWATVGHLFLDRCARSPDGRAHPEMVRHRTVNNTDSYQQDPCSDFVADPLWYSPDLLRQIQSSSVKHEIAVHTFSHISLGPGDSSQQLVRDEIARCIEVMSAFGIKPRSFVFPFNKMGLHHLPLLGELGITAVRNRDPRVRLSYPEPTESGVYKLYESMLLRTPKYYDLVDKVALFLAESLQRRAVVNIWFHPSDEWRLFADEFARTLQLLSRERERGSVWIATMEDLAAYSEARNKLKGTVRFLDDRLTIDFTERYDDARYGKVELSLVVPSINIPLRGYVVENESTAPLRPESFSVDRAAGCTVVNIPATAKRLTIPLVEH